MDHKSLGLIENDNLIILIENIEGHLFRRNLQGGRPLKHKLYVVFRHYPPGEPDGFSVDPQGVETLLELIAAADLGVVTDKLIHPFFSPCKGQDAEIIALEGHQESRRPRK
jgi:hypothetical protein